MEAAILEERGANAAETVASAVRSGEGVKIVRACTINAPVEGLFEFWRKLENLPQVMQNLLSVTQTSPTQSHWVARGPKGKRLEWDAQIINEHPNELIAWKTVESSGMRHAGSIRFQAAPGNRGTEVVVTFEYDPAASDLKMLSRIFGKKPAETVTEDLYRFKALAETGEIPTTEGQPAGAKQKKTAAPAPREEEATV